ncbi:ABC transporter permease subunit [Arthrobacter sp. ERGS1:01]|uniref:ABC transporter permease subunit n=1 Tax=Arthrobacter sp. ERGS1:01 TaxID=1704044 RepID=UPI00403FFDDD
MESHFWSRYSFGSIWPFFTPPFWERTTNQLISGFTAGLFALSLAESGYMAEIIRGGILSVNKGQTDAGLSIGLTRGQTLRRIVIPQTIRVIIPPTGNQFIGLLKASSLVSAIGGSDLLTQTQLIYGQNFKIVPLLIVATAWYLILVSVASVGQYFLERRFNPDGAASGRSVRQLLKKETSCCRNSPLPLERRSGHDAFRNEATPDGCSRRPQWLGGNHILRGVDMTVQPGEIVCVLGPSGSGKSTLLRCINHLERIDSGTVEVGGERVGYSHHKGELFEHTEREAARMRRQIGMVFQHFNLFTHMTVLEKRHLRAPPRPRAVQGRGHHPGT